MIQGNDMQEELSVERIRSRMLKNAARIWGTATEEIESTFDPIVTMLIEACSVELNKINTEIRSSQARVLSRLARILSPEAMTGPKPAHAIAHARSAEAESIVDRDVQFYTNKKISVPDGIQKEVNKEIFFSPTGFFKVFDGDVRYVACNNLLMEYKSPVSRQVISDGQNIAPLENNTAWVALELNPRIQQLDDLCFFFDWKNDPEESSYLQILPFMKISIQDQPLAFQQGLNFIRRNNEPKNTVLTEQFDLSFNIESQVNKVYQPHFFTLRNTVIQGEGLQQMRQKYPIEFERAFSQQLLDKLTGTYLWIKIQFSTAMPLSAISDCYISINSFPVTNRKLNKLTYRLQNNLNIVPLPTDDLFLDLNGVQTTDGKSFIANPLSSGFRNDAGHFTLRNAGIERFDARQSVELLENILDLLRDESAAFSSLGNDFINGYIRQINQALSMIENRLDQKGQKNKPTSFILVRPHQQDDNIFIRYWTTNGLTGNQIKAGTRLLNYSSGETKSESLILLTSSFGGRESLDENEKISAYKKSLLSHDRIVTEEDIRTTSLYELGIMATDVTIRKNWEIIQHRTEGLRRVIEVCIRKNKINQLSEEEWAQVCEELRVKLERRSAIALPIKVVTES